MAELLNQFSIFFNFYLKSTTSEETDPKSQSLKNFPLKRTFSIFKSRCARGGFIVCMIFIPSQIYLKILRIWLSVNLTC